MLFKTAIYPEIVYKLLILDYIFNFSNEKKTRLEHTICFAEKAKIWSINVKNKNGQITDILESVE